MEDFLLTRATTIPILCGSNLPYLIVNASALPPYLSRKDALVSVCRAHEVGPVLFELAFELLDQASDDRALLAKSGNDMWIGHPHMLKFQMDWVPELCAKFKLKLVAE